MRSKTLLLLTLLPVLLMQNLTAQESQTDRKTSADEYGIDLKAEYSGVEVLDMLLIIEEEAITEIKNAYEEGYKQGTLEFYPDVCKYQSLSEELEKEVKKSYRNLPVWTAPVCLVSGIILGIIIH